MSTTLKALEKNASTRDDHRTQWPRPNSSAVLAGVSGSSTLKKRRFWGVVIGVALLLGMVVYTIFILKPMITGANGESLTPEINGCDHRTIDNKLSMLAIHQNDVSTMPRQVDGKQDQQAFWIQSHCPLGAMMPGEKVRWAKPMDKPKHGMMTA